MSQPALLLHAVDVTMDAFDEKKRAGSPTLVVIERDDAGQPVLIDLAFKEEDESDDFQNKTKWTKTDDANLRKLVEVHGPQWKLVSKLLGKRWDAKQARHRYMDYARPGLRTGTWSPEEDARLKRLRSHGLQWKDIQLKIEGRSANACKNRWHIVNRRRLKFAATVELLHRKSGGARAASCSTRI